VGFNRRKMEDQRREAAEKEAAGREVLGNLGMSAVPLQSGLRLKIARLGLFV
jgi:hypothetical protein